METKELTMKETTEFSDLIVDVARGIILSAKDKKLTAEDMANFMPVVMDLVSAIGGIKEIPAELKDMDVTEATALVTHVATRLALDNEKAKVVVESSLKILVEVYKIVKILTAPEAVAVPAVAV